MTVGEGPHRARVGSMPPMDLVADLPRLLRSAGPIPQLSRYAIVSAIALAVDFAVFLGLNALIGLPTVAGVSGYGCGIIVHYHLSCRFVFDTGRSCKSAHRRFSEFVASGLVGLAATAGAIAVGTAALGLSPLAAKVLAAAASFIGVFVIRRTLVFA